MSKIQIKPITYGSWGNCIELTNDVVELVVTLDFGPRIIRYSLLGAENVFYEDVEREFYEEGIGYEEVEGRWYLYGGHRLWTSPQVPGRASYPDNYPVEWTQVDNGIRLSSKTEKWNQVLKEIEISLDPVGSAVKVIHRITNKGPWPIEFSIWALTVMASNGTALIPLVTRDTGALPNRSFYTWPGTRLDDPRITWGEQYMKIKQEKGSWLKLGLSNESGIAAYQVNHQIFIKEYDHSLSGPYPNQGSSFELYTNEKFLELESLSKLCRIDYNETMTHAERWLLANSESLIDLELIQNIRELSV